MQPVSWYKRHSKLISHWKKHFNIFWCNWECKFDYETIFFLQMFVPQNHSPDFDKVGEGRASEASQTFFARQKNHMGQELWTR